MGVIFFVGCKDCKVSRDLDKFYTLHFAGGDIEDRKTALEFCDNSINKDEFRVALLLSFLSKHYGHNIKMFDDCGEDGELDEMPEEKINFW